MSGVVNYTGTHEGTPTGGDPATEPVDVDVVRALICQVERAVRAELLLRESEADLDFARRQLADERGRHYETSRQLADALVEVRRLRVVCGEVEPGSHHPDVGP